MKYNASLSFVLIDNIPAVIFKKAKVTHIMFIPQIADIEITEEYVAIYPNKLGLIVSAKHPVYISPNLKEAMKHGIKQEDLIEGDEV